MIIRFTLKIPEHQQLWVGDSLYTVDTIALSMAHHADRLDKCEISAW